MVSSKRACRIRRRKQKKKKSKQSKQPQWITLPGTWTRVTVPTFVFEELSISPLPDFRELRQSRLIYLRANYIVANRRLPKEKVNWKKEGF